MIDFYYSKLRKLRKTSFSIKDINTCYLLHLFVNTKNFIYQFDCFRALNNLQLIVISNVYNYIAIEHLYYQKIINLIVQNYYWPKLKKIVQRYIQNCHTCKYTKPLKNCYNSLLKPL